MDKNTQQQASWEYFDGTWHVGVDGERENYEMFGYPTRDIHTAPPVPRDVLMAALGELDDWIVDESGLGIPYRVREEIADRYASQVQPDRNTVTLEEMVAELKAGENGDAISEAMTQATADMELGRAIREGRANQQDPVERQLVFIDHGGGHGAACLPGGEAMPDANYRVVVKSTKPGPVNQQTLAALKSLVDMDVAYQRGPKVEQAVEVARVAIAAAEAAQPVGEWNHCSPELLASGIDCGTTQRRACQCPHGGSNDHFVANQPANVKPVAVPDEWHEAATVALRFIEANAGHDQLCGVFDLDDEGRHKTCTCGMEDATKKLRAMLSAAPKPEGGE